MKNLKKNLQGVNRDLKALANKIDKIIVAVDKLEKAKTKTAPAKPVKKPAVKKPTAKKTVELSAADTVLGFIKRSRKGIDTATLMERTGFNQKKIFNVVYKLKKQGNIKSVGKGVYLKG